MKRGEIRIVGLVVITETEGVSFRGTEFYALTGEELEALREMARAYLAEKKREGDENQHR